MLGLKVTTLHIHYVQWRVICSPNLVLPNCIEDFTQPPKPTSNLTVLFWGFTQPPNSFCLGLSSLYLWVWLLLLLLVCLLSLFSWWGKRLPFRRLLLGFCWILLSPRSTCLVHWAVSSLLPISWMASLDIWNQWCNLPVMPLCWWSVHTGRSRCMRPSFWFVLWCWGRSFWSLVGDTSKSTLCRSCLPSSPFLPLFWPALVPMVIVPAG